MNYPSKVCVVCGREITWRKKWEKNWHEVRYCGEKCRRSRSTLENGYEEKILAFLKRAGPRALVDPAVLSIENADDYELIRQAARRLAHRNLIEIFQGKKAVKPEDMKGAIQLKLK